MFVVMPQASNANQPGRQAGVQAARQPCRQTASQPTSQPAACQPASSRQVVLQQSNVHEASRFDTRLQQSLLVLQQVAMSGYHFGPFEAGQVKAYMSLGMGCNAIAQKVYKPDGKSLFSETAIVNCMNKLKENPRWRGDRQDGSGAVRKTNAQQDKRIVRWLLRERGKQKVTVSTLKQKFRFLRKFSDSLVEARLHEAHLKWLRRRRKSIVTRQYLEARVKYCQGIKRKHQSTLDRFAYTDGTLWYLDRTQAEAQESKQRSLGTHVWRRADNQEAMYQDCLGPSCYNKGQGIPVRVWGMLACGGLNIHVLDEGETMTQEVYAELVEDKFDDWCGNCEYLVCDYERCLRSSVAQHALSKTSLKLVEDYPKVSQDFNAIENAWAILKERLAETQPTHMEDRGDFIKRLHTAVRWMNKHRSARIQISQG